MFENNNEIDSPSWEDEIPSNIMFEENDEINNEFPKNTETIGSTARNLQSMKSPVELSLLSKFLCYITWFIISPD